MEKIIIHAEKTNTGYSVYTKKYAVITTANSEREIRPNMVHALNLWFEATGSTRRVQSSDLIIEHK